MAARLPTTRRWSEAGQRFLAALGISAIPIGILAPLDPTWWEGKWWVLPTVALLALAWAMLGLRRKYPSQNYVENVTIRLVVGDLFEQNADALVGVTTTFDTLVPDVISPTSVQAGLLREVYGGSVSRLDKDIQSALHGRTLASETVDKPGKQVRYPLGTTITLSPADGRHYYCAAYTEMDSFNRATGSIKGVLDALDACWEQADLYGNGGVVCVPLIGQGLARIPELTPEISVRLIAFSFLLRSKRSRFSSELRIVLHPKERRKVNLREFQAFLTSIGTHD